MEEQLEKDGNWLLQITFNQKDYFFHWDKSKVGLPSYFEAPSE